jgi:hypothetical protein
VPAGQGFGADVPSKQKFPIGHFLHVEILNADDSSE